MVGLLVNIDVPDIDAGIAFYTAAFGLVPARRFGDDFVELTGAPAPFYLLRKGAGSRIAPSGHGGDGGGDRGGERNYDRHWTPVHVDLVVDDLDSAAARAEAAGATRESGIDAVSYGRIATFADPFGHGFCLIEFNERGYDALSPKPA